MRRLKQVMSIALALLMLLSSLPAWSEGEPIVIIDSVETTTVPQAETTPGTTAVPQNASAQPSSSASGGEQPTVNSQPESSSQGPEATSSTQMPSPVESSEPATTTQAPTQASGENSVPETPSTSPIPEKPTDVPSETQGSDASSSLQPSQAPEGEDSTPVPSAQPSQAPEGGDATQVPSAQPSQTPDGEEGTQEPVETPVEDDLPLNEINLLSASDAAMYMRSVEEGNPLRIIHLNVYNGYTGVQLMQAALVEGGSSIALPVLSENEAYTHTGWESFLLDKSQAFCSAETRTVSFEDIENAEALQTTDNFGTIIINLRSTYTVKNELPVYSIAFYHEAGMDAADRIGSSTLTLSPEDRQTAYALPDVLPEGATWVLASADGKMTRELPEGKTSITYNEVYERCVESGVEDASAIYMYIKGEQKDGIILTFYEHSDSQYWDLNELGSVRLYEGEAAKAIPQLEEREGYSAYWRGVYGGVYLDDVLFEAGATLTYEQLMESLGAAATSLPVAEGSYKRLEVCAYYEPDSTAGTDKPFLQVVFANGGQTIGSVTLAPGDENVPLSYSLPSGVTCAGWRLDGQTWPADKATVSYAELEALIAAGAETQNVSSNCIAVRAELIVEADAEQPVIINVALTAIDGSTSYSRLYASGQSLYFPVSDVALDGQRLVGWQVEYFIGGSYNSPAHADALVPADTASLSYNELLNMISVAGIILDYGLPTVEVHITPVLERETESRVIEVVLDASAWTRSGARVRVYEDSAEDAVSLADGYETYTGYRSDIMGDSQASSLSNDFATLYPGCTIDGWYIDGQRVLSAAYPTAVSFAEVDPYAEFDENGYAKVVLTPSVRFTGDCTDNGGEAVETTYTVNLILRDEGSTQTLKISKGDTVELPAPGAAADMVFAGWELADGTLFKAGTLTFEQLTASVSSSLISYSAPVYTYENGQAVSAVCEASLELTALYTPTSEAQEDETRIIVTFYGSYDKLLARRTVSSVTPEAVYTLPTAEAPSGKVFNGWTLTSGDTVLRWYASRASFTYDDVAALCPDGGEITAQALFGASETIDPTLPRAILYYNDAEVGADDTLYLNMNTGLSLKLGPEDILDQPITWTSSNTTIATVTPTQSGALVNALGNAGYAIITAQVGSLDPVSVRIYVNKLPTSVSLPATEELVVGETMRFTATISPSGAYPSDILWSVENLTGAASVDERGNLTAESVGQVRLTAQTLNGHSASCLISITNPVNTVVIEAVGTANAEVGVGDSSLKLRATAYGADGTVNDVQQRFTWKSSNTRMANVLDNGDGTCTIAGVSAGTVKIYAYAADGTSARGEITVRVIVPVTSVTLPESAQVFVGGTTQLKLGGTPADATYQDASDFTWETSDDSVATVKDGVVTGLSHGTAIITATSHNGLHDSCLVRVIVPTDEITITLIGSQKPEVYVDSSNLTLGAIALGADDTTENIQQSFTWKSSDSRVAQVRDNLDGTCTVYGVKEGAAKIYAYATDGTGVRGEVTVYVIIPVEDFEVQPATANVFVGKTVSLSLDGTPANATYSDPDDFTWESDDESIVTVNENGVVTGVGCGTATITATSHNGIEATSEVNVTVATQRIELSVADGGAAETGIGEDGLLVRAVAYGADGASENVSQDFDWRVSNADMLRITDNGDGTATVEGLNAGTFRITAVATDGTGVRAEMNVRVIVPVTSFHIIPATANLFVGRTLSLKPDGEPINATYHTPADFDWRSSDEAVATVSENGVVTGIGEGTATITATSHNGIEATCTVSVGVRTEGIELSVVGGGKAEVSVGQSDLTVRAVALGEGGTASQDFEWRVSNSSYARIADNGDGTATITGLRAGTIKIAAIATDGSGTREEMTIRVIVPVTSYRLYPNETALAVGDTISLKPDGEPANATYHKPSDFSWESDNTSVATVNESGVVTAVGEGTATIIATSHNGIEATCAISVTTATQRIELSLVNADKAEVGIGETGLTVRAVAYGPDGAATDVSQRFEWRVNNADYARITDNGDGTATVAGLREGTIKIAAIATDGSEARAEMSIRVIVPVESYRLYPNTLNLFVGKTASLKPDGEPANATYHTPADFEWRSSNTTVATVSESGVVTAVGEGTATITATSHNGIEATCAVKVGVRTQGIELSVVGGGKAEVSVGESDLTVRAVALGGSVSQDFEWRVSNSSYARIADNGDGTATITGLRAGTIKIAAIATDGSNVREEMSIRVIVPVKSFQLYPSAVNLSMGDTVSLKPDGEPVNATYHKPSDFEWRSSDPSVATVSSSGVVTCVGEGSATITAISHNGISATCAINANAAAQRIELSLVDAEKAEVGIGESGLRVRAVAYGPDGATDVSQSFEWRVNNASYATITDNGNGMATVVGLRAGIIKIAAIATDGSDMRAEMSIRVIVPVKSFQLYPNTLSLLVGRTASLKPDGEPVNATYHTPADFEWRSSDETVATVSENGVVTGIGEGTATITATSHNGIEATCAVNVSARTEGIELSVVGGGKAEVSVGESDLTVRAVALGEGGTASQDFEWRVSNSSFATIADNGDGTATVTGLLPGTIKIAAIATDGSEAREEMSVRVIVPVERFWLEPDELHLFAGDEATILANGLPLDATYQNAADFTWESSDEEVATVSDSGVVTAAGFGEAVITVTSHNGLEVTCPVSVSIPVAEIRISTVDGAEAEVAAGGDALRLQAVAYAADGTTDHVSQKLDWTCSSNASVSVDENGICSVSGLRAGTATITATATDGSGVSATFNVRVIIAVADFTLPEGVSVLVDGKTTLQPVVSPANATYSDPSDFTWESANKDIATIDENGVLTGVAIGTATITATSHNGIEHSCEIAVTLPAATVEVEPVDFDEEELAAGEKLTLHAVAYGEGGTTDNVAQSFTWTSSDTSIAAVTGGADGNATVTGVSGGTAIITATAADGSGVKGEYSVTIFVPVTALTLPESETVMLKETLDLGSLLTYTPADATTRDVEWTSSDDKIATVSTNGVVTPVAVGDVVITVTSKDYPDVSASCTVAVRDIPDAITIVPQGAHIPHESQANTSILYYPISARPGYDAYQDHDITLGATPVGESELTAVTWQVVSGASHVTATTNDDGTLTLVGRSAGNVTVRATSQYDSSVQATYYITVAVGIIEISYQDVYETYSYGKTFQLPKPDIAPTNATFQDSDDFVWMSSDESIVTVNEKGVCTIRGTGTAYISIIPKYDRGYINYGSPDVISNGYAVTIGSRVTSVQIVALDDNGQIMDRERAYVARGGFLQLLAVAFSEDYTEADLEAGILPDAEQHFAWSMSRNGILVEELHDEETGYYLVRASNLTPGDSYVTLTATYEGDTSKSATFNVRVVQPMTGISGIPDELVLHVGDSYTFEPVGVGGDERLQDFYWHDIRIRDEHIASMSGNTVTALSPGTLTLTVAPLKHGVQYDDNENAYTVTASCELTVVSDYAASLRINGAADGQAFLKGDVLDLSATVLSADGESEGVDQKVTWTISDTNVLDYNDDGELVAVGTGKATITATARDKTKSGQTVSQSITVWVEAAKITNIPEELFLVAGKSYTFEPALSPADDTVALIWDELSAEDAAVLSLSGNTVTGLTAGTVTLTVRATGLNGYASCKVTVSNPPVSIVLSGLEDGQEISMGDKIQLTATVLDANGNTLGVSQNVIWDCSNWGIANVENGLVAPYSMGDLTITATSAADASVSASVSVHVGV